MRDIKFRGLSDNSDGSTEFVYGLLTKDLKGETTYYDTHSYRIHWHPEGGGRSNKPVRNGTIGQFTGLHDECGAEIYEGDIVLYKDYSRGAVISISGEKRCQPRKVAQIKIGNLLSGIKLYGIGILDGDNMEVIGNIHQNPELLEQKQ